MEKRKYTKIQVLEPEIVSMQEAGKTHREIAEHFGLGRSQIKKCLERYRSRQRKQTAGIQPKSKGRLRKDGQLPHQSEAAELKRLRMENQLPQDFLEFAGGEGADEIKYHVIYLHRNDYPVTVMCQFFGISRSGYYDFCPPFGPAGTRCGAGAASSGAASPRPADLWLPADAALAGGPGYPPQPQNCAADYEEKLAVLSYELEQYTNADENDVPESVIEAFAVKIVASKDGFDWNLRFDGDPNDPLHCTIRGKRKSNAQVSVSGTSSPAMHDSATGRNQESQIVKTLKKGTAYAVPFLRV